MANFRTFSGESPVEALKKAQQECGEKAILVTTKQVRPKTINQKPLYEILVSIEDEEEVIKSQPKANLKAYEQFANKNTSPKTQPVKQDLKPKFEVNEVGENRLLDDDELFGGTKSNFSKVQKADSADENILLNISNAAKKISEITNVSMPEPGIGGYNKKIDDVAKQVNFINDRVNLIADMFWDERAGSRNNLVIPPEFATIYKLAKKSGMKDEHLEAIMKTTIENMPASMKNNPAAVRRYFYSLLRKMLPCRNDQDTRRQKIMMLVGPTGVGKTTTLAKLAARYAYSGERRYKTGIITLDTYRIGAVEQLFQYAKMMKLPILDVIEVDDFANALKQLNHCEVILIDTTGNSQYDKEKLAKLEKFLKSVDAQIDVNLVLSAGSKIEDLLEIYNGFSFLDIDTLIITKFDETKIFGNVFSLIYDTHTPVSFFSVGQEVPDDIMVAKSEFLVDCILGKDENE
ncbi:MAG: flagellar biosynthesis protein FlhF [Campylobacter sp.]